MKALGKKHHLGRSRDKQTARLIVQRFGSMKVHATGIQRKDCESGYAVCFIYLVDDSHQMMEAQGF